MDLFNNETFTKKNALFWILEWGPLTYLHHKSQAAQSKPFVRWKRSSSKTSRSDVSASKSKQATVPFLRRLRCNSVNASNYAIWSSELQDTMHNAFQKIEKVQFGESVLSSSSDGSGSTRNLIFLMSILSFHFFPFLVQCAPHHIKVKTGCWCSISRVQEAKSIIVLYKLIFKFVAKGLLNEKS